MKNRYSKQEKKFLKTFGTHIRVLRKKAGFSQEDFALEVGLDRTYIGGIERGERNIALLNLHKIATGLKIPLKDLFDL